MYETKTPITAQPQDQVRLTDFSSSSAGWGAAFGGQQSSVNKRDEIKGLQALQGLNECCISTERKCCGLFRSIPVTRTIKDVRGNVLYRMEDRPANVGCCGNTHGDVQTILRDLQGTAVCSFNLKPIRYSGFGNCEWARSTINLVGGDEQELAWLVVNTTSGCCVRGLDIRFDPKLGDLRVTVPSFRLYSAGADKSIMKAHQGQDEELCVVHKASCCAHKTHMLEFKTPCEDATVKLGVLAAFSAMIPTGYQTAQSNITFALNRPFPLDAVPDVPLWLKGLRLHKYTPLFQQIDYEQMLLLDEHQLERNGVTKGARKKIVNNIERLKERVELIKQLEKDAMEPGGVRTTLMELRQMVHTPIRPYPLQGRPEPDQSKIDGLDLPAEVIDKENLPAHVMRVLAVLQRKMVFEATEESTRRQLLDDDCYHSLLIILDRCGEHEAFTLAQKRRCMSYRQALKKIWTPQMRRRLNFAPPPGAANYTHGGVSPQFERRWHAVRFHTQSRNAVNNQQQPPAFPKVFRNDRQPPSAFTNRSLSSSCSSAGSSSSAQAQQQQQQQQALATAFLQQHLGMATALGLLVLQQNHHRQPLSLPPTAHQNPLRMAATFAQQQQQQIGAHYGQPANRYEATAADSLPVGHQLQSSHGNNEARFQQLADALVRTTAQQQIEPQIPNRPHLDRSVSSPVPASVRHQTSFGDWPPFTNADVPSLSRTVSNTERASTTTGADWSLGSTAWQCLPSATVDKNTWGMEQLCRSVLEVALKDAAPRVDNVNNGDA